MDTMSPVPRGLISKTDQNRIDEAMGVRDKAVADLRKEILGAASRGASVRELAKFTGLSTNTISRWKRDDK